VGGEERQGDEEREREREVKGKGKEGRRGNEEEVGLPIASSLH